ncbi:MAG TPA: glycoside hydrolase family 44 protein, partial [bacterium]|nr:glycoside hydrolase family 44 protein [bacterium]
MIKFINLIKDATIKIPRILFLPLFPATLLAQTINFTIDPTLSNNAINPFSYGSNASITAAGGVPVTNTFYRQGGNRMSAYNWENNASNAGTDWYNESDWYLVPNGVTAPGTPATTISAFVHGNNNIGADSLITLQMAGYVAADGSCVCTPPVTAVNDTTNTYWKAVSFVKGSPFADPPVTTDNNVYMDELMYYLGTHVGYSSSGGAKLYDLDNEPALWNSTHPMVHPAQAACSEVAGKGVSLAAVITQYDSGAQILGPVAYGWGEYTNNQSAPDTIVLGPYNNGNLLPYLNYYLAQFNTASTSKGRRLLHYLDLHWYPEALGNNGVSLTRITVDDVSQGVAVARMQAPRSLWDPSYSENSWITWGTGGGPITLIPRLQNAVSQYYPGTKLFFSEYQYGAGEDISGGVAEADALGIFTKYGVGASWWPDSSVNDYYLAAAYRLYLNYDGAGSKFGDTSILATSSGANAVSWTSVYAAKNSGNPNQVNVILINKDYGTDHAAAVTLNSLGTTQIYSITAYRFDTGASQIYSPAAPAFNANSFSVTLPHRSATLYKITLLPPGTTPTNTPSPTATSTPSNSPTRTPQNTSTSTPTHSPTKTPSNTPTNSLTDTPSKTATNSPTATFSSTPTNSATNSPSLTPTPSPTHSPTP